MATAYEYQELIILRLLELNSLMPHYWSEFMVLAFQLLEPEEQKMLKKKVEEIEHMVLEDDVLYNKYKCLDCLYKFKSKTDWFDIHGCPKCQSTNVKTMQDRHSLYDIEFAIESNRDFGAFFMKYGKRITKFDVERKLNLIKRYIFMVIRERAQTRRFKRFR
jgi:Zn finger protein HypA/HybF involved in hydrogenase expression